MTKKQLQEQITNLEEMVENIGKVVIELEDDIHCREDIVYTKDTQRAIPKSDTYSVSLRDALCLHFVEDTKIYLEKQPNYDCIDKDIGLNKGKHYYYQGKEVNNPKPKL